MKISKLFHWLYATLMFLPFVFFLPSCLYYGFNEHATNTETTTINYKYQSNEVNTIDDLIDGNIYHYETFEFPNLTPNYEGEYNFDIVSCESLYNYDFTDLVIDEYYIGEYDSANFNYITIYIEVYEYAFSNLTLKFSNGNGYVYMYGDFTTFTLGNVDFIYYEQDYTFFDEYLIQGYDLPQYTDYNVIESVEVNTSDTISDKLSYSWQRVWDLPLFSWTHNSFVSAPFTYISGLFGIQANSTLNYVFTYFVSISICWLVFDLLMYVPNLAHRWLDKGALE